MVNSHGYFGVTFCTSAMFIGNFMLLNLFLAILIKYTDEKNISNHLDEKQEATIEVN
jgi:regulatory protein YycI of two-component signal transduction system YycFG